MSTPDYKQEQRDLDTKWHSLLAEIKIANQALQSDPKVAAGNKRFAAALTAASVFGTDLE